MDGQWAATIAQRRGHLSGKGSGEHSGPTQQELRPAQGGADNSIPTTSSGSEAAVRQLDRSSTG